MLFFLRPLLYLNMAGMALGAAWLASLSQWPLIGLAALLLILSPYVIPLLMIPVGVFSHLMLIYRAAQRPWAERAMFALSMAYLLLFFSFWCTGLFEYVMQRVGQSTSGAAALIWANAAALAPLLLWVSRDRDNIFMVALAELAQLALLALSLWRFFAGPGSFWGSFAVFGGLLALAALIQALYEAKSGR